MQGRVFIGRVLLAAVVVMAAGACLSRKDAAPTPLPTDDSSFSSLLTSPSPSPSPSPTPSPEATSSGSGASSTSSSGSGGGGSSAPAKPASGKVFCPSGRVSADLTDLDSNDDGVSATGRQRWDVHAKGTATNGTSAVVRSIHLTIRLDNNDDTNEIVIAQAFAPGSTINWSGSFSTRGDDAPSRGDAQVFVTSWSYADSSLASCPT